jgi:hypothetical protein
MKWPFFTNASPASPRPVERILVRQSVYDDGDPQRLVAEVVDFVNTLISQGMYLRREIPINALYSYHTDYYLAQVSNGGHGQFVANSGWQAVVVDDISAGLRAMAADPYSGIFQDLRTLIETDPVRAQAIRKQGGFGEPDPAIATLDKRYFAADAYKTISPANARWLRSLSELEVVPDARYSQALQALIDANPQREQRLAARKSETLLARLDDPLWVAARLLCTKAHYLPMIGFGGGDPVAKAPDGRQGTGWTIKTGQGLHVIFLFDDVVLLCDTYLQDGRKLTQDIIAEHMSRLRAGQFDELGLFSNKVLKDVAQLPAQDVSDAIAAARQMPMLAIARLFCEKLKTGETVHDVFAGLRTGSGQFVWFLDTGKRLALFGFSGDRWVLSDAFSVKEVASLSAGELARAVDAEIKGRA